MQLPEVIDAGEIVLRRWEPQWAAEADAAIRESRPELAPFLPWAQATENSSAFIERSLANWPKGTEFNYAIFTVTGDLAGSVGVGTRMGPGVLEIGYWLRTGWTGHGYMTAAVRALTPLALAVPGIERVAIRWDVANPASGAVAARAGFVEVDRRSQEPEAPGESGTQVTSERRT